MDDDRVREVDLGEFVLRLDGNVLEVLHESGSHERWHVNHVAVEARPKGTTLRIRIGVDVVGQIIGGTRFDVPPEHQGEVTGLFEEAVARRTRQPG